MPIQSNLLKVVLADKDIEQRWRKLPASKKLMLKNCQFVFMDFDGVFTDNKVYVDEQGREMVRCDRSDAYGVELLNKQAGVEFMIISSETNLLVSARAKKVGIPCRQGVVDKLKVLNKMSSSKKISLKDVIYIGNDINDLDCLQAVGLAVTVSDAYPPIRKYAGLITAHAGGNGALREVFELLIIAQLAHKN